MDIGDVECMVLFYLFGRSLFLWLFMVFDRLCGCVPCLRYPGPERGNHLGYIIIIIIIFDTNCVIFEKIIPIHIALAKQGTYFYNVLSYEFKISLF